MNDFEEAKIASEELMEGSAEATAEGIPENTPAEGEAAPPEEPLQEGDGIQVLDNATKTAELAAEVAAEKDSRLQQALADIEALKQQNQQLQGTIDEISRQNTENIIEDVLKPPTIDINSLAFADEETQKAAQAKYAADMAEYNRKQIMKELSPAIEYAKKGMREAEKAEAISMLSQVSELSGIKEMLPQLDRIIENNKWLSSDDMPMEEKYINAYALARGVNSMNTPPPEPAKEPTTEELMALYNSNPAFQEMVEKQRLEAVKGSQQVPPFSASSGAVNAALNIKEKPKTFEESLERSRRQLF